MSSKKFNNHVSLKMGQVLFRTKLLIVRIFSTHSEQKAFLAIRDRSNSNFLNHGGQFNSTFCPFREFAKVITFFLCFDIRSLFSLFVACINVPFQEDSAPGPLQGAFSPPPPTQIHPS